MAFVRVHGEPSRVVETCECLPVKQNQALSAFAESTALVPVFRPPFPLGGPSAHALANSRRPLGPAPATLPLRRRCRASPRTRNRPAAVHHGALSFATTSSNGSPVHTQMRTLGWRVLSPPPAKATALRIVLPQRPCGNDHSSSPTASTSASRTARRHAPGTGSRDPLRAAQA